MNAEPGSRHRNAVLKILGAVALVLIALLTVPFLVDLKFLKEPIQDAVRRNINGEVDFSSANLNLIPRPGISVKDFVLRNTDPGFAAQPVIVSDRATISAAIAPLFRKQIVGDILIHRPEVTVLSMEGRSNITALIPEAPAEESPRGEAPRTDRGVPQFLRDNVVITSIAMEDAAVVFRKSLNGEPALKATAIDAEVRNIGFNRDITGSISTNMELTATDTAVDGPVYSEFTVRIDSENSGFADMTASINATVSLNELAVRYADLFLKEPGVPMSVTLAGSTKAGSAQITSLSARIHQLALNGTGMVNNFSDPVLTAKIAGGVDNILAFADLFPRHQSLFQSGSLNIEAAYDGPVTHFETLNATVNAKAVLSGSDLALSASARSFQPLHVDVTAESDNLDVAALLDPVLKENPLKNLAVRNTSVQMNQRASVTSLSRFRADVFDGQLSGEGTLDSGPTPAEWSGRIDTKSISVQTVLATFLDQFKDIATGKLFLAGSFSGTGFDAEALKNSLTADGTFRLENGVLHTAGITPEIEASLTGKIKDMSILSAAPELIAGAEKILENPVIRELPEVKKLDLAAKKQSYERWNNFDFAGTIPEIKNIEKSINGSFAIKNGRIAMKTSLAVPAGTYAFDGSVGLDKTVSGNLTLTTSQLTNERINSKSQYASLLFNEQGALVVPVTLYGEITSPSVSLVTSGLQKTFTANAKALVEREVKEQLDAAVRNALAQQRTAIEKKINELPEDKKQQATGILKDILKKRL